MQTLISLFYLIASISHAQTQPPSAASGAADSKKYGYEVGLHAGALLPSRIPGVVEILNVSGMRLSTRLNVGSMEADYFSGRGDGTTYHSLSTDYRLDLKGHVPAHVLLGAHFDYFRSNSVPEYRPTIGWHYGGGMMFRFSDMWWARFDFKYRFGPGNSVVLGLGLVLRFPEGGSSTATPP